MVSFLAALVTEGRFVDRQGNEIGVDEPVLQAQAAPALA